MPPQPAIAGSRTFVGPSAGGEGPWYYKAGGNTTLYVPDCKIGDTIIAWVDTAQGYYVSALNADIMIGMNSWAPAFNDVMIQVFLLVCNADGTVAILTNASCLYTSIIAHKTSPQAIAST